MLKIIFQSFYFFSIESPSTWAEEEITVAAAQLPTDAIINSNGAGDAFTSGLLVAAMLRNTGIIMQYNSPVKNSNESLDFDKESVSQGSPPKKVTPYSLYMRENYISLKAQCSDDKTAIFAKCNQMWEEESDETKEMYERKAKQEMMNMEDEAAAIKSAESESQSESGIPQSPKISRNLSLVNKPMNLETAAQFASLVAARHVDTSTRDDAYLNINTIREQSSVSAHGLEEI